MKTYLELSRADGPLFLLGAEKEPNRLVAWGCVTDHPAGQNTHYDLEGVTYASNQPIPSGVSFYALEDGPHTTLDKPLILRKV